jgi:hypothetical protein
MGVHAQLERLLDELAALGSRAIEGVAALLVLYIAFRCWQCWRFRKALCAARISVAELHQVMNRGDDVLVLDVRSHIHRRLDDRTIPGSTAIDIDISSRPWPPCREMGDRGLLRMSK